MSEIYIDNLYKQLYATDFSSVSGISAASSNQMTTGLSDFGELPGQSTWYIRSIRFKVQGYQDEAGPAPDTRFRLLGGIMQRDISDVMAEVDDYQDINGWPLKDVQADMLLLNNPQHNWFSYTKTWKPREHLTLNREQDIIWTVKNVSGNDLTLLMSLYIHAERGD